MLAAEVSNAAVPMQVTLRVLYQTLGAAVYVIVYRLVYPQSARQLVQSRVSAALVKARTAQRDTLDGFVRFARLEATRAAAAVAVAAAAVSAAPDSSFDGSTAGTRSRGDTVQLTTGSAGASRVTFAVDVSAGPSPADGGVAHSHQHHDDGHESEPAVDAFVLRARSIAQRRLMRGHAEDDHDGDVTGSDGGYLRHHVSMHSMTNSLLKSSKRLAATAAAVERGYSSAVQLTGSQARPSTTSSVNTSAATPAGLGASSALPAAAPAKSGALPAAATAAEAEDPHFDPTSALQAISGILSGLPALLMDAAAEPTLFGSPFSRLQRRYDAVLGGLRRVSRAVASVHEATMGLRAQALAHSSELPAQLQAAQRERQLQLRRTLVAAGALSVRPPSAAPVVAVADSEATAGAFSLQSSAAIGVIASPEHPASAAGFAPGSTTAAASVPAQLHPLVHPELHIALPRRGPSAEEEDNGTAEAADAAAGGDAAAELTAGELGAVPVDEDETAATIGGRSRGGTDASIFRSRAATDAAATVAAAASASVSADAAHLPLPLPVSAIPSAARGALALGELLPSIEAVGVALNSVLRYVCTVAAPDAELLEQIQAVQARRAVALAAASTRRAQAAAAGATSSRRRAGSSDFMVDPAAANEHAPVTPVAEDDELAPATDEASGTSLRPAQAARMRAMTLLPAAVSDMTTALHAVTAGFNALLLAQAHGVGSAGVTMAAELASHSPPASTANIDDGASGGAGAIPVSGGGSAAGSDRPSPCVGTVSSGSGLIFTNLQELCVGTFTFALQELVEAAAELALAVRRLWHAQGDPFGSLRV